MICMIEANIMSFKTLTYYNSEPFKLQLFKRNHKKYFQQNQ
jgi:YHS domain-containing protein